MKKTLLSTLAVLGIAGMAFAGDGTENSPYSVDEVIAMGTDANKPGVYVQGYIVGWINGMSYSNAVFGLPTSDENQTNIILAGASAEDDMQYCIPVQLPSGDVRKSLNLYANPDVLGHEVILGGDIVKYFGLPGFKNTSSYKWVGDAPELGTGGGGGNTGGSGSDDSDAYLVNNMDGFTIQDVNLPEDLSFVWQWDSQYGAKASAYYNSTNYAAESILISPEITLSADTKTATISQALNFLNGNNRADYVNVVVREGATGSWNTVNVSAWPAGSDWGFVDECEIDLSAYAGKTIQIGFRYTSTNSCAPTWEVKRLKIGGTSTGGGNNNPSTTEWTVAEALTQITGGYEGKATVKGYIVTIDEYDYTNYGNATYSIGDEANSSNTLKVYRGYYFNGDRFTAPDQIKVGDLVVVEGNVENFKGNTPEFKQGSKIISINGETGGNTGGGNTGSYETGSQSNPLTVDAFLAQGTPSTAVADTYVCGYIVGYINGMNLSNAVFGGAINDENQTNIMIAASANVTSTDAVIPVQLPKGEVRDGLNLYANPQNLGKEVTLHGSHEKYFGANGLKNVSEYWWGNSIVDSILAADDAEAVYFNLQGQKVVNPEKGIFIKVVNGKALKVVK